MVTIPAPAQALLGGDAVAHVWTCNPDGSPQVSVVWVIVRGDEIVFGTDRASVKARNLRLDPRVILSIEDTERNERGYQRHLIVHGTARLSDAPDPDLMDRLARKYLGLGRHPLAQRDASSSVVVSVGVDRLSGVGPWVEPLSAERAAGLVPGGGAPGRW